MTTLTADNLLSEIIEQLSDLPHAQRVAAVDAYLQLLDEPERLRLKYAWELYARESQMPPEGDWDTWAHTRRTRLSERLAPEPSGYAPR